MIDGTPLLYPYNGTWRFCLEVVRGLSAYGHDVTVVAPWHIALGSWPTDLTSVVLVNGPRRSGNVSSWRRFWWEIWSFPWLAKSYDVAIAPYFSWSGIASRRGVVISVLDVWPFYVQSGWANAVRKWLLRHSADRAWGLLTISDFSRMEIRRLLGRASDRVYLGADCVDCPTPLQDRQFSVLYIGGYEPRKDVEFLLESIRAAGESWPTDAELLLVGQVPARLRSAFADLGIAVRYVQEVEDEELQEMYDHARVFVYPSRYEGFGLPPVEAMAHGTPVVVRGLSSLPEVVADGGCVVRSEDPAEFGRAVVQLLEDDTVWWDHHMRARKRAQELTWASCHASLNAQVQKWEMRLSHEDVS